MQVGWKILLTSSWILCFCHFEKLYSEEVKLNPSHSLATEGAVLAVEAFTFFFGLAWYRLMIMLMMMLALARCQQQHGERAR